MFGTFRTREDVEDINVRFYSLQTCKLRNVNRFEAIKRVFKGDAKEVLLETSPKTWHDKSSCHDYQETSNHHWSCHCGTPR